MNQQHAVPEYQPALLVRGFIKADLPTVANAWIDWYKNFHWYYVRTQEVSGAFPDVLGHLLPMRNDIDDKILLLPLPNGWTAVYTNKLPGSDNHATRYIGEKLKVNTLWVRDVPAASDQFDPKMYEGREFLYWYYLANGHKELRTIKDYAWSELGLQYESVGDPLTIETKNPSCRKLTSEMLSDYIRALGIDEKAPDFSGQQGLLIHHLDPRVENKQDS